jgi:parallel beta-helix repeat protein
MKMEKRVVKISILTTLIALSLTIPLLAVTAKIVNELPPIIIDDAGTGDYTWATAVNEPWCEGLGTPEDPYIIKNVIIDGTGTTNCLIIRNSIAHFQIMKCKFKNADLPTGTGLLLYNTQNGIIFKNQFLDNGMVFLGEPTGAGVSLINSHNNIIKKNAALRNVAVGIYMDGSDDNVIVDNYCSGNTWGIMLFWNYGSLPCTNNQILRNDCIDNFGTGIVIGAECYNNIVTKNLCKGGTWGISIGTGAWGNKVTQNDCILNTRISPLGSGGIILYDQAYLNEIRGNDCSDNIANGILVVNIFWPNSIEDNLIKNNIYGISMINAHNQIILGNDIVENLVYGLTLSGFSSANIINHNNFINNAIQASDESPWMNDWNGNYWSDYPGADTDGDGIGNTHIPWPFWESDNSPYMKENGWKSGKTPAGGLASDRKKVLHSLLTGDQRITGGSWVSAAETNYLIVAMGQTKLEKKEHLWSPPYSWTIDLDDNAVELRSFWWYDKKAVFYPESAMWQIFYHIYEPNTLDLGWHDLAHKVSFYNGIGKDREQIVVQWQVEDAFFVW